MTKKSPVDTAITTRAVISTTSIGSTIGGTTVANSTQALRAMRRAMAPMTESTGASITKRRVRSIIGAMTLIHQIAAPDHEARLIGRHLLKWPKRVEKLR